MSIIEEIKNKVRPYIRAGKKNQAINRLFRFDECYAFKGIEDRGFTLIQNVSDHFQISLRSIHIVGSAQIGHSIMKERDFRLGSSDLDIAIVNTQMFLRYSELCYKITNRYTNRTGFPRIGNLDPPEVANRFSRYLAKGYLRPDYMPICNERDVWLQFFERLGDDYIDVFKKITCGIYLSEEFFSSKQEEIIDQIVRKL